MVLPPLPLFGRSICAGDIVLMLRLIHACDGDQVPAGAASAESSRGEGASAHFWRFRCKINFISAVKKKECHFGDVR